MAALASLLSCSPITHEDVVPGRCRLCPTQPTWHCWLPQTEPLAQAQLGHHHQQWQDTRTTLVLASPTTNALGVRTLCPGQSWVHHG